MIEDVRDKPSLSEADVLALNFIRRPARYVFRRHYRVGLRSHIMEVLRPRMWPGSRRGLPWRGSPGFRG